MVSRPSVASSGDGSIEISRRTLSAIMKKMEYFNLKLESLRTICRLTWHSEQTKILSLV